MIQPPAIIDTNVVVAGILTKPGVPSPPVQIVNAMLDEKIHFLLDLALIAEYRDVLLREKLRVLHGQRVADVDHFLERLALGATTVEPRANPTTSPPTDAHDRHLWCLLGAVDRAVVVTGDRRLSADLADYAVTSRQFVELALIRWRRLPLERALKV